jgi:hypothetical protein
VSAPPIPQRIPPLVWRRPAILWTPLALALGISWPAAMFFDEPAMQRTALIIGAAGFALALVSLGASWLLGRAPKARRIVVLHVVVAGGLASLAAPFVTAELLTLVTNTQNSTAPDSGLAMAAAAAPLALVLGLPIALVSGLLFAWVALATPKLRGGELLDDDVFRHDVQPFR